MNLVLLGNQNVYSNLNFFRGAFLLNVKWFGYKIGIQFNNNPLVAEQKSDAIKTVNAYVVFDLSQWPRNLLNNVVLKIWLFGANNIVKI